MTSYRFLSTFVTITLDIAIYVVVSISFSNFQQLKKDYFHLVSQVPDRNILRTEIMFIRISISHEDNLTPFDFAHINILTIATTSNQIDNSCSFCILQESCLRSIKCIKQLTSNREDTLCSIQSTITSRSQCRITLNDEEFIPLIRRRNKLLRSTGKTRFLILTRDLNLSLIGSRSNICYIFDILTYSLKICRILLCPILQRLISKIRDEYFDIFIRKDTLKLTALYNYIESFTYRRNTIDAIIQIASFITNEHRLFDHPIKQGPDFSSAISLRFYSPIRRQSLNLHHIV